MGLNINKQDRKESNISPKEELELKIKNRFSWLIIGSVSIFVVGIMYAFIFGNIEIDFITIVTLAIAFFSIYLSALFYFKATEQSNNFYDRSFNHTRQIQVLLSQMEGKFNKSLDILEKGNETIREKIDTVNGFEYLGNANSNIQGVEQRKERFLEDTLFSKLEMSLEEKQTVMQELHKLEKEKSLLQYQLNEILDNTTLKNERNTTNSRHNRDELLKWFQNKKGPNSYPGTIYEIIYEKGPANIINMPDEKLRDFLRVELLSSLELDKNDENILLETFINLGFVDEKTKDISNELIRHIKQECEIFLD